MNSIMEKDTKSEASLVKTPEDPQKLKDTISKSISDRIIDPEQAWKKIHDNVDDSEARSKAWDELNEIHTHNENVNRLNKRITKEFYAPMESRIEVIRRLSKEAYDMLGEVVSKLQELCHHQECENPDGCPSAHTGEYDDDDIFEHDCNELLNLMSPFYWIASRELGEIQRDIRIGVLDNEESPLAMVFALSKCIYRYDTIFNLAGQQTYHDQHDESYSIRGLEEFYNLREGEMWSVKTRFMGLKDELTEITVELQEHAEAWKVKEQSE